MARRAAPGMSAARMIRVIGLSLALGYLVMLSGTNFKGEFLTDAQRQPIANDFVNVVAAGRLALAGNAAAAYDWPVHKKEEVRAVGHDFDDYYGWHYPATFLFVAAALATLPYLAAAIGWLVAPLAAYVAALRGILGPTGIFVALGFPAAIWNIAAGQNGFFTAALIGGTLGLLERQPALAGVCLGLLTYKPQFGLLFPIVLIADRRWTTIMVAAAVALGPVALSLFALGSASWAAFLHWMPITSHIVLGEGRADFGRLQSLFGLVGAHGGGATFAWTVQAAGRRRGRGLARISVANAALPMSSKRRRSSPARSSPRRTFICMTWSYSQLPSPSSSATRSSAVLPRAKSPVSRRAAC